MSDNDKKNVDETAEDAPVTETDGATAGGETEATPEGNASDSAAATATDGDASSDEAAAGEVTQEDAPSDEEREAAEAEAEDKGLDREEDFRNLVANAAGITGPDQPRPMHAEDEDSLSDDALRARGMERDFAPNLSLVAMVIGVTVFVGLSAVGVLQLWRYATDSSLDARNWSVVDPALAALADQNRELIESAGPAHGEDQEGEVRFPAQRAASLLLENPEWLARHPLAPASETVQGGVDSAEDEPHLDGGEAAEEQAGTPPPPGADPQDEPAPESE